jgi:hypothetical protein
MEMHNPARGITATAILVVEKKSHSSIISKQSSNIIIIARRNITRLQTPKNSYVRLRVDLT